MLLRDMSQMVNTDVTRSVAGVEADSISEFLAGNVAGNKFKDEHSMQF